VTAGHVLETAGGTPLVSLSRLRRGLPGTGVLLAKLEGFNPAGSVKDRVGIALVREARANGKLRPGMELVEPTSGNTGIALAMACAVQGIPLTLAMPDTMSLERRRLLAHYGARLLLTPGAEGMAGAMRRAEAAVAADPSRYHMPDQFSNPANPGAHEAATGPELWEATGGGIGVLVCAVGTGGTLTGIARHLRRRCRVPPVVVAVEPAESRVIGPALRGEPPRPGPHAIQGIGAGFLPATLDLGLVDRAETVTAGESVAMARRLAGEEGISAGLSSGAAVAVAVRLAGSPEFRDKTVVTVLADTAERYMSTILFGDAAEP